MFKNVFKIIIVFLFLLTFLVESLYYTISYGVDLYNYSYKVDSKAFGIVTYVWSTKEMRNNDYYKEVTFSDFPELGRRNFHSNSNCKVGDSVYVSYARNNPEITFEREIDQIKKSFFGLLLLNLLIDILLVFLIKHIVRNWNNISFEFPRSTF